MAMILTEEQEMLQATVREFVGEHAPITHLRALRDAKDADGFSRSLWKEMAELGWTGITIPEEHGGSGLGYAELGVLLEECGRTLLPEPLLSSLVLGAEAIQLAGETPFKESLLPAVAQGDLLLTVAFQEGGRFSPYRCETQALTAADRFALSGEKIFVPDGHVADRIIVVARSAGAVDDRDGLTLFVVDPSQDGVSVERSHFVDSQNSARLTLSGVSVSSDCVLGRVRAGADILDPLYDRATAALCAQMLGCASEAFDRTVSYLKTREQFGAKIGSFQALKHRAAEMFCELELSRSVVLDALRAIDEEREELPSLVSAAKARLSDTCGLVTREGIQMHGGIGMTDEEEIGFFLKRAKVQELWLGDASYHRDRFARLQGF